MTERGPIPALSVAAVTIVALESKKPIAKRKALAWLDAYQALTASGVDELQARVRASAAWDAA